MSRLISFVFCAIFFPACYFLLLDYIRPILEERTLNAVWWLVLGGFLATLFGFQFRGAVVKRPRFFALGFLLLCATAYTYDPTINPRLADFGLKWIWIPLLFCLFLWLYSYAMAESKAGKA